MGGGHQRAPDLLSPPNNAKTAPQTLCLYPTMFQIHKKLKFRKNVAIQIKIFTKRLLLFSYISTNEMPHPTQKSLHPPASRPKSIIPWGGEFIVVLESLVNVVQTLLTHS